MTRRRWTPRPRVGRDLLLLATPCAAVIVLALAIALPGIYALEAARAYVAGEGFYSKAQKQAAFHLSRYALSRDPGDWQAFERAIAVPRADARARLALQRRPPAREAAAEAFRAARNHPRDVPGMIRVFAWAPWLPEMRAAIRIWQQGDANVERLYTTAQALHAELESDAADPARVLALLEEVDALDTRLTELEDEFSSVLGGAARRLASVVRTTACGAGALLLVLGFVVSSRVVRQVRRGDETYRTLIERAHDIITVLDAEGVILYTSAAVGVVLGYRRDEIEGRSCLEFVHPDDRAAVASALIAGLQGPAEAEFRFRHRGGVWRTLVARGGPFPLGAGETGIVVNSRDVTERLRLEQRLAEAERMESVGRLAGGVAHDFNNLLAAIAGSAALVRHDTPAGSPAVEELDVIRDACERAQRLTAQLLAFARRQVVEIDVLDANDVLRGLQDVLRRLLDGGVELVLDLCPDPALVRADRSQLEQVMLNLAVNARDAMPEGGTLVFATRVGGDPDAGGTGEGPAWLRIDVTDTGEAMSEEVRQHVFEPFFTTKEHGTGLGLATCYGIVRQAGGHIHVESEPSKGTCVRILWPRAEGAAAATAPRRAGPAPRGGETVLLAEDEPAVSRAIRRLLERQGYRVIAVGSGEEALRVAAEAEALDLLFTDIAMPGMNGRELADRLRAQRPGLPVIFASGYAEDAALAERMGAPEVCFVAKPFDPDELVHRVREVLDARVS